MKRVVVPEPYTRRAVALNPPSSKLDMAVGLATCLLSLVALAAMPAVAALAPLPAGPALDPNRQWGQWRGPLGTGVAPSADPPLEWAEDRNSRRNIRWKRALPGAGHSTPVVWGDRIFLTTAVPYGEEIDSAGRPGRDAHGAHDNMAPSRSLEFTVLAIDRADGHTVWQRTVRREPPHEGTHVTGSWASNSAVTDGEHLIASFGSRGIYGFDLDGKLLWEKDLGDMETFHAHGEGSSPALHGDTLVVNWDHQGKSFVVALDKRTGNERWRAARNEITSWSTPLVVEHAGKAQVIVSATHRVRGYDLATGKVLWECGGLSRNVVASPVAGDGMVFVANSYDTRAMLAIRLEAARGDITGTDAVAWTRRHDTPYVPSLLLDRNRLVFLKHNQAILTAVEARTGKTLFGPKRLPGIHTVFASPVAAADRLYVIGRGGTTVVLRRGDAFEVLAVNHLEDTFSASPAIVGNEIYLRGLRYLYAIGTSMASGEPPAARSNAAARRRNHPLDVGEAYTQ